MADDPPTTSPPRRRDRGPTPALCRAITLNTIHCQRIYRRVWDRIKADIFVLTVRTRIMGFDDAGEAAENFLEEQFAQARADLAADIERADVLMDEHELSDRASYGDHALRIVAEYTTPQANQYLDLLLALDELLMRHDSLWLSGIIAPKERTVRGYEWQRRLIKLANRVRNLGDRTRQALNEEQTRRQAGAKPRAASDADSSDTTASPSDPTPTQSSVEAESGSESDTDAPSAEPASSLPVKTSTPASVPDAVDTSTEAETPLPEGEEAPDDGEETLPEAATDDRVVRAV